MQFLTDFADQAVMLPFAAVVGLALALSGWWRGCAAWAVAVVGVLGSMAVLKYVFFACSSFLSGTGVQSPSGHTAAAAIIMGGALALFLRGRIPAVAVAAIPLGIAVLIGVTRLAVHAHSVPEVLFGGAVGLAGAGALVLLAGPRPPMAGWPAAVGAVAVLVGLHGLHLRAETTLHHFSLLTWLPLPAMCHA